MDKKDDTQKFVFYGSPVLIKRIIEHAAKRALKPGAYARMVLVQQMDSEDKGGKNV